MIQRTFMGINLIPLSLIVLLGSIILLHADYQLPTEIPLCEGNADTGPAYDVPVMATRFFPLVGQKKAHLPI